MADGYIIKEFTDLIDPNSIKTIMELGARYGDESLQLSEFYPNCKIHSFECNPEALAIARNKLANNPKIELHEVAVSNTTEENIVFYPAKDNVGASSLYKATLGKWWGDHPPITVKTQRLDEYFKIKNIENVDLICADIQGGELKAFDGMGEYFKKVKYIITETPQGPPTYEGAPSRSELFSFLSFHGFEKIAEYGGNNFEQDVMFVNKNVF